MDKSYSQSDPEAIRYAFETFRPEDEILKNVRKNCLEKGLPEIQIGTFDGKHLEILTRIASPKKAIEIGTLGGYSGICIARGLPADGHLDTLELYEQHAQVARESFEISGLSKKITVHVGEARATLKNLSEDGPYDFAFIDADKVNYPFYLEWCEKNLRSGGVLIADNTFGFGLIQKEKEDLGENRFAIQGLRKFNQKISQNKNFRSTLLPTGEGMTLAIKL